MDKIILNKNLGGLWKKATIPNSLTMNGFLSNNPSETSFMPPPIRRRGDASERNGYRGIGNWYTISFDLPEEIKASIEAINVDPGCMINDKPILNLTKDGEFTTASAYKFIHSNNSKPLPTDDQMEFNWIWKYSFPNKIKIFLWLMFHNKLPTSRHLNKIGLSIQQGCQICGHHTEDFEHIFFKCAKATSFWDNVLERNTSNHKFDKSILCINNWHKIWGDTKEKNYNQNLKWQVIILNFI